MIKFSKIIGLMLLFFSITYGQVANDGSKTASKKNISKKKEVFDNSKLTPKEISQIYSNSENHFKNALQKYEQDLRDSASKDFDEAVKVFIKDGIYIYEGTKIDACYYQLIITIQQIEFYSGTPPEIKVLAEKCDWSISQEMIDSLSKSLDNKSANADIGFNEQIFNPSPLDELSKLQPKKQSINYDSAGIRPMANSQGQFPAILNFINKNFNDPYSVRFVDWSKKPRLWAINGKSYWLIAVKYRAKNVYNAYILSLKFCYIQNNKVIYFNDKIVGEQIVTWEILLEIYGVSVKVLKAANGNIPYPNDTFVLPHSTLPKKRNK